MKIEPALDLQYNFAALDMIKMLEQGMKLEEVGQIYGMTKAGISARISRYKKRTSQTAI